MKVDEHWPEIKRVCNASFSSSLHFAVATLGPDGGPHLPPIGSLMLGDVGRAVFFERFPRRLGENITRDARVCILAVNSGAPFWLSALARARF